MVEPGSAQSRPESSPLKTMWRPFSAATWAIRGRSLLLELHPGGRACRTWSSSWASCWERWRSRFSFSTSFVAASRALTRSSPSRPSAASAARLAGSFCLSCSSRAFLGLHRVDLPRARLAFGRVAGDGLHVHPGHLRPSGKGRGGCARPLAPLGPREWGRRGPWPAAWAFTVPATSMPPRPTITSNAFMSRIPFLEVPFAVRSMPRPRAASSPTIGAGPVSHERTSGGGTT